MLRRLLDSPRTYFVLAGLLLVAALPFLVEVNLPSRPKGGLEELDALRERDDVNILFVLIDTLRADRLSSYGHERETSPVMDRMAASGVRFAHVQSQSSWTKASMASLWTGIYPSRIGVTRYDDGIAPSAKLPAEILREAGFRTAGIFRNGWLAANFGFGQGFEMYVSPRPSATPLRVERYNPSAPGLQGSDVDATESAREFIRGHAHERFFLYVHYMDVHQYLYEEESGKFGTDIEEVYDNAIHWTDRNVSAVLAELQSHDLLDRTLVVIASDHGEAFYEHGLEGHARNLYREVTETPLILILPFRLEPGVVIEERVQNVDIWPTLLDLLGLPPLENADGRSLVPALRAALGGPPVAPEERPAFAELDRNWGRRDKEPEPMVAVVDGPYRMVRRVNDSDRVELYDRRNDPREQQNVAALRGEVVEELSGSIEGYVAAEQLWEAPRVELDEMRLGQLMALGYIDLAAGKEEEAGKVEESGKMEGGEAQAQPSEE